LGKGRILWGKGSVQNPGKKSGGGQKGKKDRSAGVDCFLSQKGEKIRQRRKKKGAPMGLARGGGKKEENFPGKAQNLACRVQNKKIGGKKRRVPK